MTSESSSTTGSAGAVPVFMSATNRAGLLADAKELAVEIAKSAYSMKEIAHMVSERQDSTLAYRLFTLVSNCDALAQVDEAEIIHATTKAPVVFVFSGQIGSNPKISTELYRQNESIRNSLDACEAVCKDLGLNEIISFILGENDKKAAVVLHCAVLAGQIATAKTWLDCGLTPDMLVGHSIGQLAALHIAGVISLEQAFKLVVTMTSCAANSVCENATEALELQCEPDEIQSLIHSFNSSGNLYVDIACYNSRRNYIVTGNRRSVEQFRAHCSAFEQKSLTESLYFHCAQSKSAGVEYEAALADMEFAEAKLAVETCSKDQSWREVTSAHMLEHARGPVYFTHAVKRIHKKFPSALWLELGSAASIIECLEDVTGSKTLPSKVLSVPLDGKDTLENAVKVSSELWKSGNPAACWFFSSTEETLPVSNGRDIAQGETSDPDAGVDSAYASQSATPTPHDPSKTFAKLQQILNDIMGMPESSIKQGSHLSEMGLKSALANTVLSEVQEYFGINIEKELTEKCVTIGDVVACIDAAVATTILQSRSAELTVEANSGSAKTAENGTEVLLSQETVVFKTVDGLDLEADIFYPPQLADPSRPLPVALMVHGGGHVMLSRHDTRPQQTARLLQDGFLPITVDYRLCPEVPLKEGPMTDVVDALGWCRNILPTMKLKRPDVRADGNQVVAIGWSTGGTLVMSLGFNSLKRGVRPPDASLVFYCPLDYEDPFWMTPNMPIGSEFANTTFELDDLVAAGLSDKPITKYNVNTAKRAVGGWMSATDGRSRLVLYMNWHGRALHVLLNGLNKADLKEPPTPTEEEIISVSPLAQIRLGNYSTPTFIIHSQEDDLIPWQQAHRVWQGLQKRGVDSQLRIIDGAPHLFDLYTRYNKRPDLAHVVKEGYDFLQSHTKFY